MTDGYFDLADLEAELSRSRRFLDSFDVEMLFKVDSLKQLTRRLPRRGEIFFIETTKSFTAFTFIVHVLKAVGHIHHLYIATYSTNERIINALLRYRDRGQLESIHLHISETLRDLRDKGILQLTFAWTHKKVTCMDTPQGAFVVEGSGNYGENALEEQYIFIQSEKVYEFRSGQVPRAKPQ